MTATASPIQRIGAQCANVSMAGARLARAEAEALKAAAMARVIGEHARAEKESHPRPPANRAERRAVAKSERKRNGYTR